MKMEVKQFVDRVNKLRLANRGKWYWFNDTVGGKAVRIKAFGTWMQIYDVDGVNCANCMERSVTEFKSDLKSPFEGESK